MVVYDCFDSFAFRVVKQKLGQQHPQESQCSVEEEEEEVEERSCVGEFTVNALSVSVLGSSST